MLHLNIMTTKQLNYSLQFDAAGRQRNTTKIYSTQCSTLPFLYVFPQLCIEFTY